MIRPTVLMLGSKDFPNKPNPFDPLPSGGMEQYVEGLSHALISSHRIKVIIISRVRGELSGYEVENRRHESMLQVIYVPFNRGKYLRNPTFNFRAFLKALRLKFDVIMSHGDVANVLGLVLSKLRGKPIIMVCHGIASEQPQYNSILRYMLKAVERTTYRLADAVVANSEHQARRLVKRYVVIRAGLDRERLGKKNPFFIREFPMIFSGRHVILFTGRLVKVKGVEYLLRALPMVRHPYVCMIVGDGTDRNRLEMLAKVLKVNVVFTGHREDVADFLSCADIFVMPSVSGESMNYSMIEATYKKVPIVATDLKILPSDCGLIVPARNPEKIADSINAIIENKDLCESIARNAFKFSKSFDWKVASEKYYDLIARLAQKGC